MYEPAEVLEIPIAHGDGRYVADERTAAELEAHGRVVWRYVRDNPNGSTNAIAGVCNAGRNVLGIMPHPERRTASILGGQDGARIFHSMRSEEHTSELQSRLHLVCRLLLEKKNSFTAAISKAPSAPV